MPAYFWSPTFNDWLVFSVGGGKTTRTILPQLLVKEPGPILIAEKSPQAEHRRLQSAIATGSYHRDVDPLLPQDFSPRAILDGDNVILIARTAESLNTATEALRAPSIRPHMATRVIPSGGDVQRQHFRFSRGNWVRFCAKAAFELLCFLEGGDLCQQALFGMVRKYVLDSVNRRGADVIFDRDGPIGGAVELLCRPVHVDMTVGQNAPSMQGLLTNAEAGTHVIALYELKGWICASVTIAGFPPVFLVLAGPNAHLHDFYLVVLDGGHECHFSRLAYDQATPAVPMSVTADFAADLAATYRLRRL